MRKPAARGQKVRSRPARPAASFASDRQELLELLLREGIRREPTSLTVSSEDGSAVPWKLDSLGVTLSSRGAELAGRCMLHLLENFEGRQLATYGAAGVPILQSCVLLSKGKYHGLIARREKGAGPGNRIEGRIDPSEPVVLIHDSVGLETSMEECVARLEEAGLRVEGGVCLVRFGYESAFSRLVSRGYRMLALFDIWNDLVAHMPEEDALAPNPTRAFPPHELSTVAAPEGLHPAELARRVIEEALRTGKLLRPPRRIQGRYSGAGGVWVSVRPKDDLNRRHARGGFWNFPEEKAPSLPVAIGEAAFQAAQILKDAGEDPLAVLKQSAIGVTFCSALEECEVGQLDNERYGLVVRSRERPFLLGGLMPRMPGISNAWQQLEIARNGKARLLPWEPFILYRFKVQKAVEPGTSWQPSGVPAEAPPKWIAASSAIAARALEVVQALSKGREPAPVLQDVQLDGSVDSLSLSVYRQGQRVGTAGGRITNLDEDLVAQARSVLAASRSEPQASSEPLAVTVSLLHGATELGELTAQEAAAQMRHGEQALMAYKGDRVPGMLVACRQFFTKLVILEVLSNITAVLNLEFKRFTDSLLV